MYLCTSIYTFMYLSIFPFCTLFRTPTKLLFHSFWQRRSTQADEMCVYKVARKYSMHLHHTNNVVLAVHDHL